MIQQLASKYSRPISFNLFLVSYIAFLLPVYSRAGTKVYFENKNETHFVYTKKGHITSVYSPQSGRHLKLPENIGISGTLSSVTGLKGIRKVQHLDKLDIGGPSQPEMSSFKPAGVNNLVNLFSGDFNYNIPLLDVDGYPVNLFYNAGISPEQESSWVGLGWNLNPGNINRNMRGVPDDFDGTDTLIQAQRMKKNQTWGLGVNADIEALGLKLGNFTGSVGVGLGVSFNNYLGPALDLNIKGSTGLKIAANAGSEKSPGGISAALGVDLNSRTGLTLSPSFSLTANVHSTDLTSSFGIGLSTSYNSRSGIKAIQISEQARFNSDETGKKENKGKDYGRINETLYSNSISFVKPSYIPAIRMPLTNTAYSGHVQYGGGIFGIATDLETEIYSQTSEVAAGDIIQYKPLVGYLYYQNAVANKNAVMDFTRFNDKEVTPNTPIISVPQYTYDVFSIQGEGTGGSIRAYRSDYGYVRDNTTVTRDNNVSLGFDLDPVGHFGGNFNTIKTPSTIGEWVTGNKLRNTIAFTAATGTAENVYMRNPGETSVLTAGQFNAIGGTDLVRFQLSGSGNNPAIEPVLQQYNTAGYAYHTTNMANVPVTERRKRTQVINFLTAAQASVAGLDKQIKSYNCYNLLDSTNNLLYDSLSRISSYRKGHHISQINVTESNGKRYIYGLPVYNTVQQDFTFSVDSSQFINVDNDKIKINPNWMRADVSVLLNDNSDRDGYVQETITPGYAHSFLLTGLLSPDYVDVTGNGITEDDLGTAVKFNYTRIKSSATADGWAIHKWRTPLTSGDSAHFNPGKRTEVKDDKGIVSYGERESWYLHSIESKNLIAVFHISNRDDGKGPVDSSGAVNANDSSMKKLDRIDLYNKADLKKNGIAVAKPIKSVLFNYSYRLAVGTPDNTKAGEGKLTLESINFLFNGQTRTNAYKYIFYYTDSAGNGNPNYMAVASDRWGGYKPASKNPGGLTNSVYPYSIQDTTQKGVMDQNAGAWSLKRILLPSGGQIQVNYETDDYAYVQNLRATDMMQVVGLGSSPSGAITNYLYTANGGDNSYLFIKVPRACYSNSDVYQQYLQGISQLAVKLAVNMPKGVEYITSYATINPSNGYGVTATDPYTIWVKLATVDGVSPLTLTAMEYLREQLPGQAFTGYDVSGSSGFMQVGEMLLGMIASLKGAFTNPINQFRSEGKAMTVVSSRCFARLNDPDGFKYGGGHRVKSVVLKDNWNAMTGQYNSVYGQQYNYTTTETFNGGTRVISSGVASYEPSIGGDENPFQTMIQVTDKVPLGPASYGAIEMPVLDAFFPAASVGYSKVTVTSLKTLIYDSTQYRSRSGVGKQVTEFYTAKDYPVYFSNTSLDPLSDLESHTASTTAFFHKYQYDYRALSQGFLVATNDMHGKMKSQSSYAANDTTTRINYTQNFYRNTGNLGLGETFNFASGALGGQVNPGNMGIDIELMTDAREFSVKSSSLEVQGQADLFPILGAPIWIPTIWPVTGNSENTYRAVTTTKVISYHSVLDSVLVIDKGSQVSTKNLVYDAETGTVLVNRTNNEFNQPEYSTSYPAYWGFSGMGLAYKNIGATFSNAVFSDGKIVSGVSSALFESGDEILIQQAANTASDCRPVTSGVNVIWAYDTVKNSSSFTNPAPQFIFLDSAGNLYTNSGVSGVIIRSGHRNILDAQAATVSSMVNPVVTSNGISTLTLNSSSKVLNAGASEYQEKWQTDNDVIQMMSTVSNGNCGFTEQQNCSGDHLERTINPYRKGLLGNFKAFRSRVFYGNRTETDPTVGTNLPQNGFLAGFSPFWKFNTFNNLIPDTTITSWVWNNSITRINAKGMELETKNALNIYTGAEYGYDKTLPVAITNNSKYNEMFAEGFEDNNYLENLNKASIANCSNTKQIYLAGLGTVINADSAGFNAHTGKYALSLPANSQETDTLQIKPVSVLNYGMNLNQEQNYALNNPNTGLNFTEYFHSVFNGSTDSVTTNGGGTSVVFYNNNPFAYFYFDVASSNSGYQSGVGYSKLICYIQVPNAAFYNFNCSNTISVVGTPGYTASCGTYNAHAPNGNISQTNIVSNFYASDNSLVGSTLPNQSVFLSKGTYRVEISDIINFYVEGEVDMGQDPCTPQIDYYSGTSMVDALQFGFQTPNCNGPGLVYLPIYPSLNGTVTCTYTKPIAGNDSMRNPILSLTPGKQMLFSAWVREPCGNLSTGVPCTTTQYTHSSAQIQFNDGNSTPVSFTPTGPIIEGWQKMEGQFTVPAGATSASLSLNNTLGSPVYFDDIRMHPYNADMKSYVYDPVNLRLVAELDPNNFASYYEYDEEGTLIRTKVETQQGIKTIKETRSARQKILGQTRCKPCPTNSSYTMNMQQHADVDINPQSPTYNQIIWIDDNTVGSCAINQAFRNMQAAVNGQPATYCVTGTGGYNTGHLMQLQQDSNSCSTTYLQTRYVDAGISSSCPITANWQTISSTCQQGSGGNTGYQTVVTQDMNPYSPTYNQQSTTTTYNTTACPLPTASGTFTMIPGFSSPTNSISATSGVVSFYLVFYSTSAMLSGSSYFVAAVSSACRPSVTRTIACTTGGRNWTITIYPSGQMYWYLNPGSATLNAGTVVGTSTLTYNL